jgi:hypothetical protein
MTVFVGLAASVFFFVILPSIFRFGYGNNGLNWLIVWLVVFGVGASYWLGDPEPKKPEPPPTQIPLKYPFRVR